MAVKKKVFIIVIALLFLAAAGLIYLNNVYLPTKIKARLAKAIAAAVGYDVSIGKLSYNPFRGLSLSNVVIYDKIPDEKNTILAVKEAYFNLLFLPLIKERKIIIPIIHIDSPELYIRYLKDNTFNLSRVFSKPANPEEKPFSLLVYKINIFSGKCSFEDEHFKPEFKRVIQDLNLGVGIKSLNNASFLIQGRMLNDDKTFTKLYLKGNYYFLSRQAEAKIKLDNINLAEPNPYLILLPFYLKKGVILNAELDLALKDKTLSCNGLLNTKGIEIKKDGMVLSADIDIRPRINYALDKKTFDYNATLKFSQAQLQAAFLKEPLNNLEGDVEFTQDDAAFKDISFDYIGSGYTLSGKVVNFKEPAINFDLASKELDINSGIKLKDNIININSFNAEIADSSLQLKGSLDIQDNTNPLLDLLVEANFKTQDIMKFLPQELSETLKKIKLETQANLFGEISGSAKSFKGLNLSLKARSDTLSLYGLKFSGLSLGLKQKNGVLDITDFSAAGYGGKINIGLSLNLKTEPAKYTLKFNSSGIELVQLKKDTTFKDKDISGILDLTANLDGELKNTDKLKGTGLVSVRKGKLWQWDIFKGLGDLFLISDYGQIIFEEAQGDFYIENKKVSTDNLSLKSEQLVLDCSGTCGFDGALDFSVYSKINKKLIRDSADIRKFTTAIWGELSSSLVIKISGTLEKPKYKIIPMPIEIIKKIKDLILGN